MAPLPQPSFILSAVRSLMYDSLADPCVKTGSPGETGQFKAKHRRHPRRIPLEKVVLTVVFEGS